MRKFLFVLITAALLIGSGVAWAQDQSAALPVPQQGGVTAGDITYWKDLNTLSNITAVATGKVLCSQGTGTQPEWCDPTFSGDLDLDDGVGASPSLTFTDATDETAVVQKADSGMLGVTTLAADGLNVLVGNVKVGNGTPATTQDGEDLYVEGLIENAGGTTLDDGVTDSPSLTFTDATNETAVLTKLDGATLDLTTVAADGLRVMVGNLSVGNGTPGTALDGEDAYIEGTLEVDGTVKLDGAVNISPIVTAGSGTGITVDVAGEVRQQVYKVTVDYTGFVTAGVTHDVTIATLPAKGKVITAIADVTTPFVCASVCTTATLSATLGITAGGVELLESFDIDAAAATFGDADSEVGSKLDIAAGTGGGYIPAWGTTQALIARFTSGTGNFGDGASATNLNAGSVTFYLTAEIMP